MKHLTYKRLLRAICCFVVLPVAVLAAATRDQTRNRAKEFPDWKDVRTPNPLQPGVYCSAITMGFSQDIVLRADGTFESHFAGEAHRKGNLPEWTNWKFSGKWNSDKGWITFTYVDDGKEHAYSFLVGLWRDRTAFIFDRPADGRCRFVAECFVYSGEKCGSE